MMDGIWQTTDRSIDILQLKHTLPTHRIPLEI